MSIGFIFKWSRWKHGFAMMRISTHCRRPPSKLPTDLERRHALKGYYELYFGKLRVLASTPDLKAYLDGPGGDSQVGSSSTTGSARIG